MNRPVAAVALLLATAVAPYPTSPAHAAWPADGVQVDHYLSDSGGYLVGALMNDPSGPLLTYSINYGTGTDYGIETLSPDGVPILSDGINGISSPAGQGGIFTTWASGSPLDVYMKGTFVGLPGIPTLNVTATNPAGETSPRIIKDGAGGAFVEWFRYSTPVGTRIRRIQADGTNAPGWPTAGLILGTFADVSGSAGLNRMVSDGAGGAYVYEVYPFAYVQRVTPAGAIAPGWPAAGLRVGVNTPNFSQGVCELVPVDSDHCIAVWSEDATSATTPHKVVMQRFDSNGVVDPAWPAAGFVAINTPDEVAHLNFASDTQGGIYAAWQQAGSLPRLLHVLSNGTVAPGFAAAGTNPLDSGALYTISGGLFVSTGRNGGCIAAWGDGRLGGMSMRLRWLQGDGTPDPDQPAEAVLGSIQYPAASVKSLAATSDGAGGAYVLWVEHLNNIYGQFDEWLRINRVTAPHVLAAPELPRTGALALAAPYPNPAHGDLTLRYTLARDAPARLELLDVAGRVVRSRAVVGAAGVPASARFGNLSDLAGGLYFVRITQGAAFDVARVALIH